MKKLILSFLLLMTMMGEIMAQNNAMYVYRNDGVINAFLKADVDSLRYSQLDLDSVFHREYVVQEVWTVDSTYRIPLAVIDSVSFITPPTVFKPEVIELSDNLLDYIIGAEDLTLRLKDNTPTLLIPRVGDKLVLLGGCDALPNGFAGKVSSVNSTDESIDVVCEQTYIEDIFDSFCHVQTLCGYADNAENAPAFRSNTVPARDVYGPADLTFPLGPYTLTVSGELSVRPVKDLALKGGASMSFTIAPTFRIHTFLIVGEGHGVYFNSSITGNLSVTSQASLYGGIEYEQEFLNPVLPIPIPFMADLVSFYFNPGLFVRADVVVASTVSSTNNYSFGMAFDYSSINESVVKPSLGGRLVSSSFDSSLSLDGSLAFGGYIEVGFMLASRELARVCARGELGWQISGDFVLRNADVENADKETALYERLKASSVEIGDFINVSLLSSVGAVEAKSVSLEFYETWGKRDIVPTFDNTKLTHSSNAIHSADACAELSGNCIFPVTVGYKLFDENESEVADYDASESYTNTASQLKHSFSDLNPGDKYTVYPKVKLFGFDILASPKAELNSVLPAITEFKQIDSEHDEGAFYNDGRYYDYRFDVSTTVEIESLEGVADWGYVYRDPYGNIKRISLMQFGKSYTDTRYAYYRNEPKSTACLYTYVRYDGDEQYYDDDPHDYPLEYEDEGLHGCPDGQHPHAIDLGLPSGTKWACCNVGASTPEGYGGYYAWGETSEKSVYSRKTYKYYNSNTGRYVNIGSDIAGTSYDVAHVRMGGSWRMPSLEQTEELVYYCSHTWTQQNGVNGILFTGPNGGQIFLPAAGDRFDYLRDAGSWGEYWSSTFSPSYDDSAYLLGFDSGSWCWHDSSHRVGGRSVRAVCP